MRNIVIQTTDLDHLMRGVSATHLSSGGGTTEFVCPWNGTEEELVELIRSKISVRAITDPEELASYPRVKHANSVVDDA